MTKCHSTTGIMQLCFGQPQIPPLSPVTLSAVTICFSVHLEQKHSLNYYLIQESLWLEMRKRSIHPVSSDQHLQEGSTESEGGFNPSIE